MAFRPADLGPCRSRVPRTAPAKIARRLGDCLIGIMQIADSSAFRAFQCIRSKSDRVMVRFRSARRIVDKEWAPSKR